MPTVPALLDLSVETSPEIETAHSCLGRLVGAACNREGTHLVEILAAEDSGFWVAVFLCEEHYIAAKPLFECPQVRFLGRARR